jgi:hypothetical protein
MIGMAWPTTQSVLEIIQSLGFPASLLSKKSWLTRAITSTFKARNGLMHNPNDGLL